MDSRLCQQHCTTSNVPPAPEGISSYLPETRTLANNIAMIGAVAFMSLKTNKQVQIFSPSLGDLNQTLATKAPIIDIRTIVPPEYRKFLALFSKTVASVLPPWGKYNHAILI